MRRGPIRLVLGSVIAVFVSSTGVMAARLAEAPDPAPRATPSETTSAHSVVQVPAASAEQASSAGARRGADAKARRQRATADGESATRSNPRGLPLSVTVKPPCGRHGDRLTAVVETAPDAHLSLVVAYSDGRSYGDWHIGSTDERGKLRFSWLVVPQAAEGPGVVLVAASDDKRSGTASEEFEVAGPAGC